MVQLLLWEVIQNFYRRGTSTFLKFVNDFATRYKGKINYYEYWNEPNTILNTNEEVYWYVRTVKELYPLLKVLIQILNLLLVL